MLFRRFWGSSLKNVRKSDVVFTLPDYSWLDLIDENYIRSILAEKSIIDGIANIVARDVKRHMWFIRLAAYAGITQEQFKLYFQNHPVSFDIVWTAMLISNKSSAPALLKEVFVWLRDAIADLEKANVPDEEIFRIIIQNAASYKISLAFYIEKKIVLNLNKEMKAVTSYGWDWYQKLIESGVSEKSIILSASRGISPDVVLHTA